MVTGK